MLKLQPARPGDEIEYARVITRIHSDEIIDPAVLRARWGQEARLPQNQGRYLIVDGRQICGIAFWTRPADWAAGPVNVANVNVRMIPGRESGPEFARILTELENAARTSGADVARAVAREDEEFHPRELAACGYHLDRRSRAWRLSLGPRSFDLLQARLKTRQEMSRLGVEIRALRPPVAESTWRELHELAAETIPDIPSTVPEPVPSFAEWTARMQEPGILGDRIWGAWCDDTLAAYSYLSYPAAGEVSTGYTATRRQFRSRGIARAVKLESIGQAIELGVESIKTDNDLDNAAILHINESLGFEPLPGLVTFLKELRR